MAKIDQFLTDLVARNGSDLHIFAGLQPRMRVYGELITYEPDLMPAERAENLLREIMPQKALEDFAAKETADFAHSLEGVARFRVNILRHLGGMGGVFRAIPSKAKSLDELQMPPVLKSLCEQTQGLILVTGKTGSGKSTTLAAMINELNTNMKGHILTIEDPIEFVHQRNNCLISQREIGLHCQDFSQALHSALREDPDVILVGEMRDLETVSIAVTAAEMGILVMGTLHTNGAAQTVDRIVNVFPTDKQQHVRTMLSTSLKGVVSQQLVPNKAGGGLTAALEILINTPATANLIRQGKLDQLETAMQAGRKNGMTTMDKALSGLFDRGTITGKTAYDYANDKEKFREHRDLEV
jgi:twitching motility protein PilT